MIIALDGPAGSGKSSIARELSKRLGIEYIDSGAIYRSLTWYALKEYGDDIENHIQEVLEVFQNQKVLLSIFWEDQKQRVKVDDVDATELVRSREVTQKVRFIARDFGCRDFVNAQMRELAKNVAFIIDGRDIGTAVFPEAKNKFYLDASPYVRAKRRAIELKIELRSDEFESLHQEMMERDNSDINRKIAPLKRAEDAHYIDTSDLSFEEVLNKVVGLIKY